MALGVTSAFSQQRAVAASMGLLLCAVLLAVPAQAQPASEPPQECAEPIPFGEVEPGDVGVGYTVVRGSQPEEFTVEVVGVLEGGIAPGIDMLIVDVSSPKVDEVGVWFGMSGSPVYVGGRLVGAVAYGLSFAPSSIAGLTPAEDMLRLLDHPSPAAAARAGAEDVVVPSALRATVAAQAGVSRGQASALSRLKLPVLAPRLAPHRLQQMAGAFDRVFGEDAVVRVAGGSSSAASAAVQPGATVVPGGNFGAALSYGDAQLAGVGTATYVCDGVALAFGHPFFWQGPSGMGANLVDALLIQDDSVFSAYKLGNLRGTVGTVEQDRLAGLRARLGTPPRTVAVTSSITDTSSGRHRDGRTDVTLDEFLADLTVWHLYTNYDGLVFDDLFYSGTSEVSWRVTGTRADGSPWSLERANRYANDFDLSTASIFELWFQLHLLQRNEFEDIAFDTVHITSAASRPFRQLRVVDVTAAVNGGPATPARTLIADPGDRIELTVLLREHRSTATRTARLQLDVPADFEGPAVIELSAGTDEWNLFDCMEDPDACVGDAGDEPGGSVDGFVTMLENQPRNDDVIATLWPLDEMEDEHDFPFGDGLDPGAGAPVARDQVRLDQVVRPFVRGIEVRPTPPHLDRLAGPNRIETAVEVSRDTHPSAGETDTVVIARADDYADALAGAPLAARLDAPLLLTHRTRLPAATAVEIDRLGARTAVVLGGDAAVSSSVGLVEQTSVERVERVAGSNRYDTARRIARRLAGTGTARRVYLTEGGNPDPRRGWPDALSVAGLAAFRGRPILTTRAGGLPAETVRALEQLGTTDVTVVGGTRAVSAGVVRDLRARGLMVRRVAGENRYDTSRLVAERAVAAGADPRRTWFATGRNFPDGLAAGPAVAADGGVLVLVDGRDEETSFPAFEWLAQAGDVRRIVLVGGPAAISVEVEQFMREFLEFHLDF